MNNDWDAWKRFEQTGCIADYLAYCQLRQADTAAKAVDMSATGRQPGLSANGQQPKRTVKDHAVDM